MKFILCFFLIIKFAHAGDLKILTWNLFLIPPPINITYQEQRAFKMAQHLSRTDHDVLLFQEAFHRSSRAILQKQLNPFYPFSAISSKGKKFLSIMGSGLMILSKHPFKVIDEVVFEDCTGGIVGDCRARKGALMVELNLPNEKVIQIINTHLQAWDNPKAIKVRKSQLKEIREMLTRQRRNGVPQLLVGDINIDGHNLIEFNEGVEVLNLIPANLTGDIQHTNGFPTPCYKNPGGESKGEWLDHIFHGSDLKVTAKVVPISGKLKLKNKERDCTYSDHYAVEGVISLNQEPISEDK